MKKQVKPNGWVKKRDVLADKYVNKGTLANAHELLQREEQSEEAFLGAQAILLLNGKL